MHPDIPAAQARLAELQPLQSPAPADATRIGVLLPLSGDGGLYGQRAQQGIELAQAVFQARHPTWQFSLVIRDSQGDSTVAREALRELVNDEHVVGVIGPLFSQEAMDLAPLSEQLAVPFISPYAPDGEFPSLSPYAFRNSLTDTLQGRFLADYTVRVLGLRLLAILHTEDPYGVGLKDAFLDQVRQLRGEVVAVVSYPPEATDFSQSVKRLGGVDDETLQDLRAGAATAAAGGAETPDTAPRPYDALFIPDYYDKVGLIAPALALYNLSGMQLLGADGQRPGTHRAWGALCGRRGVCRWLFCSVPGAHCAGVCGEIPGALRQGPRPPGSTGVRHLLAIRRGAQSRGGLAGGSP
jgi:outer membrane PBP1 activator LpoA protein